MLARDLMSKPPLSVTPETTLEEAARLMRERNFGSVLVVDAAGLLVGILTVTDFAAKTGSIPFSMMTSPTVLGRFLGKEGVERIYEEARRETVGAHMSGDVASMAEDAPVERIVQTMLQRRINHVPIVRDGKPVGVVARQDLLKMLAGGMDPGNPPS